MASAFCERGGSQEYGLVGLAPQRVGEDGEGFFGLLFGLQGCAAPLDEHVGLGVAGRFGLEARDHGGGQDERAVVEEAFGGAGRGWGG